MKKTIILAALLWLVTCANAGAQEKADSLKNELTFHTGRDTVRVMILNWLSYYTADPDASKMYTDEALELSEQLNFKKGVAHAYYLLSTYYWNKTDSDQAIQYAFRALKLFEECMPSGVSVCYTMIGINFAEQKQFEKAIQYHHLALSLNKKYGNKSKMASDYNNIGNIYHDHKRDFDSALYYYQKSFDIVYKQGDRAGIMLAYNNLGSAYSYLGNNSLALDYLRKALPLAEELNNKNRIALIHQTMGEVYLRTRNYTEAATHFEASLLLSQQTGNKRRKEELYEHLKDLELARSNYKNAYTYLSELTALKDTLYTLDRSRQIAEIQTQYETEKKEQQIRVLEQEGRIQTIWRNVLVVGALMGMLILWLILRLQQVRTRKARELLEGQQLVNEKLKSIDKLKSSLFTSIAHEFRTPLSLILAPVENELKKNLSEGKESLMLIRRSANRLLELINQLLDLSKLEAGRMGLQIRKGDLNQLASVLATSFDSLAEHRQIEFHKHISVHNQSCWFDQDKLEKIITNLLANAFKFTPAGGRVKFEISSVSSDTISIVVTDTGPGIPAEEQEHVFATFYQISQNTTQPGTGLGLSLVRELVKLHKGSITLESKPGAGSSFGIVLPITKESFSAEQLIIQDGITEHYYPDERVEMTANKEDSQSDLLVSGTDSVLVAEDNADMREFISKTLQHNNYTVFTANDGQEALTIAQKFVPSLILTDLMMPFVDGVELTGKLKKDERTSHIPVILLTAKDEQESRMDGLKTGADDYLTKPFSPAELLVRIKNLIDQRKILANKFRERILVSPAPASEISLDDRFLLSARDVVETFIGDYTFTVERMAEEMNMSRTQLLRKLKALTELSPNDFIKDIRLKRAADMIRMKADTITQIGYAVGFNDQSYFTKCFKKQFGITPTEYSQKAEQAS